MSGAGQRAPQARACVRPETRAHGDPRAEDAVGGGGDDADVSESPAPTNRLWIRLGLVGVIVLLAVGLWAVYRGSPLAREEGPAAEDPEPQLPSDTRRHVRIRGADDQIVPGTLVLPGMDPDNPLDVQWFEKQGVLVLPEGGTDYRLRVVMPGHRVQDFRAVRGGQTIRMPRGYVMKVPLRGVPEDGIPEHVRFLLRVEPRGIQLGDLEPQEIVDLMDHLGGPGSGPEHIPRGDFGYPVSREQAAAGIVVPLTGSYFVRWGLIDVKARTWHGLGDRSGRTVEVKLDGVTDGDVPQTFHLDVTLEQLQETLDKLARGVEVVTERKGR